MKLTLKSACRVGLGLVLTGLLCASAAPKESKIASGEKATLVGELELATAYGPPNFGENPETDKKETYFVLTHFSPIDVGDGDGTVLHDVTRAQLIVDAGDLAQNVKRLVKAGTARIRGKIFPATTGHHHESIVLIVDAVEKTN